jgi:hypothetical protein
MYLSFEGPCFVYFFIATSTPKFEFELDRYRAHTTGTVESPEALYDLCLRVYMNVLQNLR